MYAIKNDNTGWRTVDSSSEVEADETYYDGDISQHKGLRIVEKVTELSAMCKAKIEEGFICNALGSDHKYDAQLPQDQINIVGGMIASLSGTGIPFSCTDTNGDKRQRAHTAAQMQAVFTAGMSHIIINKTNFDNKKHQLLDMLNNPSATIVDVEAVVW